MTFLLALRTNDPTIFLFAGNIRPYMKLLRKRGAYTSLNYKDEKCYPLCLISYGRKYLFNTQQNFVKRNYGNVISKNNLSKTPRFPYSFSRTVIFIILN